MTCQVSWGSKQDNNEAIAVVKRGNYVFYICKEHLEYFNEYLAEDPGWKLEYLE